MPWAQLVLFLAYLRPSSPLCSPHRLAPSSTETMMLTRGSVSSPLPCLVLACHVQVMLEKCFVCCKYCLAVLLSGISLQLTPQQAFERCFTAFLCCCRYFDFDKLAEITQQVTKNLNKIIDINFYPVETARRSNTRNRPIGIGVQVRHSMFWHFSWLVQFTPNVMKSVC